MTSGSYVTSQHRQIGLFGNHFLYMEDRYIYTCTHKITLFDIFTTVTQILIVTNGNGTITEHSQTLDVQSEQTGNVFPLFYFFLE